MPFFFLLVWLAFFSINLCVGLVLSMDQRWPWQISRACSLWCCLPSRIQLSSCLWTLSASEFWSFIWHKELLSPTSVLKCLWHLGPSQAKCRTQELILGLPCRSLAVSSIAHKKVELGAELTWISSGSSLTSPKTSSSAGFRVWLSSCVLLKLPSGKCLQLESWL